MLNIKVDVKPDFLVALTASTPINAVAELIWNGFDAKAQHVRVFLEPNELKGLHAVRVTDDGDGISWGHAAVLFGGLGDSWKSKVHRHNGRALHGKNGKGRFKAFALGEIVEWKTTYLDSKVAKSFDIKGNVNQITGFVASDPIDAEHAALGTEVVISNLKHSFHSLTDDKTHLEITKIFAAYLTEYPGLTLTYNGDKVDRKFVQLSNQEIHLGDIELPDGRRVSVAISIIEWSVPTERVFQLCDAAGVSLHELPVGSQIRAPGHNFTVYVKSDHIRELDKEGSLTLADMHGDIQAILKPVKGKVKEHFRMRLLQDRSEIIERWKAMDIYPYEDKNEIGPSEKIERQVFDILAVNVEEHLPSFDGSDKSSKKFTFLLLAQAIRENPESVRLIMEEVLGLKKEEQEDLAALLKKTSLSRIITSARVVTNRLNFIEALNDLLFNQESKKKLLERDQLHKALETEAWIFKEDFYLAGTEKRLEDVLGIYMTKLGTRADDIVSVLREGDKQGRVDLMLSRAVQPSSGKYEYLVVELKRPKQPITSDVLQQVESYAIAVAKDNRFHANNTKWTFLVISNDMDDHAKRKARIRDKPEGMVFDDQELNVTVWAKTWAEVLDDARARLTFYSKQLDYQADSDTELEYLKKAHSKYIPDHLAEMATGGGVE